MVGGDLQLCGIRTMDDEIQNPMLSKGVGEGALLIILFAT